MKTEQDDLKNDINEKELVTGNVNNTISKSYYIYVEQA
jgi:hypothetical protein